MPRISKKQKRKLKRLSLKTLTIILYGIAILMTGHTTYLISPLPYDDFQVWRESRMHYVFATSLVLFLINLLFSGWAIHTNRLKAAIVICILCSAIPLIWLIAVFSRNFM